LATAQTFEAAALGLAIAVVAGVLAGTTLGLSRPIERTVGPTIEALRPIPAVAFIPLTLLLFGFGLPMEGTGRRLCLRLADPDCNRWPPCGA
jgi:NitT/TauT family transport system permease protein